MQYLIHGDDFGRSHSRTMAIDQLLRSGVVDRTTLICNLEHTEEAAKLAQHYGYQDRVSFHLNFSEGLPLTDGIQKTGLCKASGSFRWANSKRILLTCLSPKDIKYICKEAEAQMLRFRDMGFQSKHIDSHDWLLFNYPIWVAVKPLLDEYGFVTTRTACENWISTKRKSLQSYYRFMEKKIKKNLEMKENWSGGLRSFQRAVACGKINENTRAEIMIHPDLVDGKMVDTSNHECIPMQELVELLSSLIRGIACES